MRIEIFGKGEFVTSAEVMRTAAGLLLLVNLRERWGPCHVQGGSMHFNQAPGSEHLRYDTLVFKDPLIEDEDEDERDAMYTELVFIAECEADSVLLSGASRYQQQCKDQFQLLYVSNSTLRETIPIASYASEGLKQRRACAAG